MPGKNLLFFNVPVLVLAIAGCAGMGGENVRVTATPVFQPTSKAAGTINLVQVATDRRVTGAHAIGEITNGLAHVKYWEITAQGSLHANLAQMVKETLEQVGYHVNLISSSTEGIQDGPYVEVYIDKFYCEI